MKKLFYTIAFLFSFNSFAQVSLGVTGGFIPPINKYTDSLPSPGSGYKIGVEFMAGSIQWKFRTGIEFVSYKFVNHMRSPYTYNIYSAQYISVPLGLRYVFKGEKLKPFIDGSLNFMGNIGHNTKYSDGHISHLPDPSPNNFILSPAFGAGILCTMNNNMYLSFMVNYSTQTTYIYQFINQSHELKNIRYNGINALLSIGYNF